MGAGQSKPDQDERNQLNQTPVQFSQDVVNHLADAAASNNTSPERQSSIDTQIQSRIHAELFRLLQEEQEVQSQIELALEKENLDRQTKPSEPPSTEGVPEGESAAPLHSTILLGDLEEVRQKVDKFRSKQDSLEQHSANQAGRALTSCYRNNASRPLDCWREVTAFKSGVAQLEQDYIASFR